MKKIFGTFFLFVFLFNSMGYLLVFQLEQHAIKKEMRSNIQLGLFDDRVSIITISNDLLSKTNSVFQLHDDEFNYKGKQYDIIHAETKQNTTVFYAVNDSKEEHLFSTLEDHVQPNCDFGKTKHSQGTKNFIKNMVALYFSELPSQQMIIPASPVNYACAEFIYSSADKKNTLLPPKIA